jgi:2-polyprenyl-6-methoxyphenol hydroxylase-like FAD-dependent oxidoreductase
MTMATKTDVLISGAGPVGLALATDLARYGLAVRIVEKNPQRNDKSKALVIWARTLELINRMGCVDKFLATGMRSHGANISSGKEQIAHINFNDAATPYPFALMIPQNETERLFDEFLNTLGVQIERGVELTGFSNTPEHVASTLHHPNGHEEKIETPWLVGCDGAHSTVRAGLGMEFSGSTQPSDWMLADTHLSGVPHPNETNAYWHSDGVLIIIPITPGRFRVIADAGLTDSKNPRGELTIENIQATLDQRGPGGITISDPIWLTYFRINERKVADYQRGRVFLAGDAAHIHSPAGGQGMNTGIQDAVNLAWKLALVSRGTCAADPLLNSYSPERSAIGDQVLKAAETFTSVAMLQGGWRQSLRNHAASLLLGFSPVQKKAVDAFEELSIGYPASPLNAHFKDHDGAAQHGHAPHEGQRAPVATGEIPVGAGETPRFAIFTEATADAKEYFAALIAQYPNLLEPVLRQPFRTGGLWLVRPDGYVALSTSARDWPDLQDYLARITGAA